MKYIIMIGMLTFGLVGHSEKAICENCTKVMSSCRSDNDCSAPGCSGLVCKLNGSVGYCSRF